MRNPLSSRNWARRLAGCLCGCPILRDLCEGWGLSSHTPRTFVGLACAPVRLTHHRRFPAIPRSLSATGRQPRRQICSCLESRGNRSAAHDRHQGSHRLEKLSGSHSEEQSRRGICCCVEICKEAILAALEPVLAACIRSIWPRYVMHDFHRRRIR